MRQQQQVSDWVDVEDWIDVSAQADMPDSSSAQTGPSTVSRQPRWSDRFFKPASEAEKRDMPAQGPISQRIPIFKGPAIAADMIRGDRSIESEGVINALTGIPAFVEGLWDAGKTAAGVALDLQFGRPVPAASKLTQAGQSAVEAAAQPFEQVGRGTGEILAPGTQPQAVPESPEWAQAQQGAGANAAGLVAGELAPRVVSKTAEVGGKAFDAGLRRVTSAEKLSKGAQADIAAAIKPTTLEGKRVVQNLAPEILRRGLSGGGKAIDRQIMNGLEESTRRLRQEEARVSGEVRPEFYTDRAQILEGLEDLRRQLHVKGTDIVHNETALAALDEQIAKVKRLPEHIPPSQMIDFTRKLDQAIEDMGGWKNTSSAADTTKMRIMRGVANRFRAAKNGLDAAFRLANQDYSFYRSLADVVERRQLGDVGSTGMHFPGRGTILDDALATWAGHAVGGPLGSAIAEGANLGWQSRWFRSKTAATKQALAGRIQTPLPERLLLERGSIPLPEPVPPETSAVRGEAAFPGWGPPSPLYGEGYQGTKVPPSRSAIPMVQDPITHEWREARPGELKPSENFERLKRNSRK
jgi:hypothetical protein